MKINDPDLSFLFLLCRNLPWKVSSPHFPRALSIVEWFKNLPSSERRKTFRSFSTRQAIVQYLRSCVQKQLGKCRFGIGNVLSSPGTKLYPNLHGFFGKILIPMTFKEFESLKFHSLTDCLRP